LDGRYWIPLRDLNLAWPSIKESNYRVGDSAYSVTNIPLFLAYNIGITKPAVPTGLGQAAGALTGTYYWRATYQNAVTGFESPAGTATAAQTLANDKVTVTVARSTDPQVDTIRWWRKGGTLTTWRLVNTDSYNICQGSAALSFVDNQLDATIAVNEELDTDLSLPYQSVTKAGTTVRVHPTQSFGPFNERYVFSVGDPVRKGYVYWNKAGDLGRYNSTDNVNAISDPADVLQNGFIYASLPYVFSKFQLYALDFNGANAIPEFTPRKLSIGHGMVGKWAFTVGSNVVYFMDRDGIYATNCQPSSAISLTENSLKPIFQGAGGSASGATYPDSATFGGLEAIDWDNVDSIRMTANSKELHVFYIGATSGNYQHIVYDIERNAWVEWQTGVNNANQFVCGDVDEGASSSSIILGPSYSPVPRVVDDAQPASGTVTDITYLVESFDVVARSGAIDHGIPLTYKEYGNIQLDVNLDLAPKMYVTPYYNAEETVGTTITVKKNPGETSREAHAESLSDTYGRSASFEFRWTEEILDQGGGTYYRCHPILYQGNLLFRDDEEDVTHWEMPPSSFGNDGYFHLKDGWFTIRTLDDANREKDLILTVIVDNTTTDTYTLTKTDGEKLKRYVEFKPRRGRVFQFKIDSQSPDDPDYTPAPFRFYGEESTLRGKPWIVGASYEKFSPFGPVGYAQYRRTEGGT
jgi:hypothetical protein